jgi:hypothetical protein
MATAQTLSDTLDFIRVITKPNVLSSRLDKQLNTYSLNDLLEYYSYPSPLNFGLSENYKSTFINSVQKGTRDEHYFTASGAYQINPMFSFGAEVNNSILSDNSNIEINQASISQGTLFGDISPGDNFTFAPFGGYSFNKQIGENDDGYIYGGEGYLDSLKVPDFIISSEMQFRNEDISPRKNALRVFGLSVTSQFDENVANYIDAEFSQNRKDFYFKADSLTSQIFDIVNNIQSRIETNESLQDKLDYEHFLNIFSQEFTGGVSFRSIDRDTRYRSPIQATSSIFDTKVNELRIALESETQYHTSWFNGLLRIDYSDRDERHLTKNFDGVSNFYYQQREDEESQKDNISQRTSASFLGNVLISHTDKLEFSLFQNKLSYNTPSLDNYDDRDELLSIIRLRYTKYLNPFFDAFLNLEGTMNHIVYIYSEKSSNNNINRVLKLAAGGEYRGKNVSSLNSFEVAANYTVYDFEDIIPNIRSYSFRQFTASDSTRIDLENNLLFVHSGYLKLSEQGDLQWASFSTTPTRFLQEIYSEPKIGLYFEKNSLFFIGLRIYSLNTYNYKGLSKILSTKYLSLAPLTQISISMRKDLYLNLYGYYEFISTTDNKTSRQVTLSMEMNWKF